MKSFFASLALCAIALSVVACKGGGKPTGQVVATVNGKEITNQDLYAEASDAGAQGQVDPRPVLQRVIARELLAQYAHDHKLDANPNYPAELRRLEQDLLAQQAARALLKSPPAPSASEIAAFEAAHPWMFANRTSFQVDEVRFQVADSLQSLTGAQDMQSLITRLKGLNSQFERHSATFDTAQMPSSLADKLAAAHNGELLLMRQGGSALGLVIQSRQPVAAPADQQAQQAASLITRDATQRQLDVQLANLRKAAKIVYQPGFAPAPAPPAPAAAPAPAGG